MCCDIKSKIETKDTSLQANSFSQIKDLNIKITVQQIENEEMLFQMKVLGVDYFQGYHIGKPMPIESIKEGLGKDA